MMMSQWRFLLCTILLLFIFSGITAEGKKKKRDLYAILEVNKNAKTEDIKKSYRRLSKIYHPDKVPDEEKEAAKEKFHDLANAYEILSDDEKRAKYDQFGEAAFEDGGGQQGGGFHDPWSVFESFFGGGGMKFEFRSGGGHQQRQPQEPFYEDTDVTIISGIPDEPESVLVVNFFSKGCGHCQKMKEDWKAVGTSFKGQVTIAAINCQEHNNQCRKAGVSGYPTIRMYAPKMSPKEYSGPRTKGALSNWVAESIPTYTVTLDEGNYHKFLNADPELAKVVVCSNKKSVPVMLKTLSYEFQGRLGIGVALSGLNEKVTLIFRCEKFPSVLRVTDLDDLTGEWLNVTHFSTDVLSLSFSRIVAQKRATSVVALRELNKHSALTGDCVGSDGKFCFLLFKYGGSADQFVHEHAKAVATKYKSDPISIYWVSAPVQRRFTEAFQLPSTCNEADANKCTRFVAYRPKRRKFKVLITEEGLDYATLDAFIDDVVSGGAMLQGQVTEGADHFV